MSFCKCRNGKCGVRCPCAKDGYGCFYEKSLGVDQFGCSCKGSCPSSVPGYFYDAAPFQKVRRARIRQLAQAATAAATGHLGDEALTLDALADEVTPAGRGPLARTAATTGAARDRGDALTLDELADERLTRTA